MKKLCGLGYNVEDTIPNGLYSVPTSPDSVPMHRRLGVVFGSFVLDSILTIIIFDSAPWIRFHDVQKCMETSYSVTRLVVTEYMDLIMDSSAEIFHSRRECFCASHALLKFKLQIVELYGNEKISSGFCLIGHIHNMYVMVLHPCMDQLETRGFIFLTVHITTSTKSDCRAGPPPSLKFRRRPQTPPGPPLAATSNLLLPLPFSRVRGEHTPFTLCFRHRCRPQLSLHRSTLSLSSPKTLPRRRRQRRSPSIFVRGFSFFSLKLQAPPAVPPPTSSSSTADDGDENVLKPIEAMLRGSTCLYAGRLGSLGIQVHNEGEGNMIFLSLAVSSKPKPEVLALKMGLCFSGVLSLHSSSLNRPHYPGKISKFPCPF
ncbi:hypothetical protein V8G54_004009 [Vigna mungo]|uniref:Uncharacterized protein n=1 Tax=Vigna mungo TaxID=3915 RepID=A0AAQ3PDE1_VIGMU